MTAETELRLRLSTGEGELVGHRGGDGPTALVLHGGPALPDYTEGLAAELRAFCSTLRYTQRGVAPSSVRPPYSVEVHAADALAVLDQLGIDRAWAVGHSWGGHLALHLAVSHPERLLGVVGVSPLGAFADVFAEMSDALRRPLTPAQRTRVDEVEELRRAGRATEQDLLERWALLWPQYFARPERATEPPARVGPECSAATNASIAEHFERGTLARRLPELSLPMLLLHGADDPLPLSSVERTASLVPGARVEVIADCGHFPWWERPGAVGRLVGRALAAHA